MANRLIDLTGMTFGRLTVTGSYHKRNGSGTDEIFWTCVCSCGGKADVRGFSLRSRDTESCGCLRLESLRKLRKSDLLGMKFGRLSVVETVRRTVGRRKGVIYYRCLCECGKETCVQRTALRLGRSRSCGCLRREMTFLPRDVAGFNRILYLVKKSARVRGYEWALSDDQAWELMAQVCHYCGAKPRQIEHVAGTTAPVNYAYSGLDRKDSSKGYTYDNTVPCCTRCNYMKRNLPYDAFRTAINDVHEYWAVSGPRP